MDVEVGDLDLYGAPRPILEVVLEVVVSATAHRTRLGRLSTIGQRGHPVATLPVTNGTIRHIRRVTAILRISGRPRQGSHSSR
eukprot:3332628-Pleurochrysis_carterae.AAC.1